MIIIYNFIHKTLKNTEMLKIPVKYWFTHGEGEKKKKKKKGARDGFCQFTDILYLTKKFEQGHANAMKLR